MRNWLLTILLTALLVGPSCFNEDAYNRRKADLTDADGDGSPAIEDCNDDDPTIHPGAAESPADNVDQDCNGADDCYVDRDNDGWGKDETIATGDMDCTDRAGETDNNEDCDDSDPSVSPDGTEEPGDGTDQDCDGDDACFEDLDGDGYGSTVVIEGDGANCDVLSGASSNDEDCDDGSTAFHPGATDVAGDQTDHDCDGDDD